MAARGRKPLRAKAALTVKENTDKKPERKVKEAPKVEEDEDIDVFASPPVEENPVSKQPVKTRSIKALNRWGTIIQASDWSIQATSTQYWPLIGQ